ncbi:MAG: galactokinase family protein [Limisphaerales bacterium]
MPAPPDQAILDLFKRHFGYRPPVVTRAPAVVTLLGDLAETCDGLALTVALERHVWLAAAPRTDGRIEIIHADRAPEIFWISDPRPSAAAPWADLFKAVLRELRTRKVHFNGFSAALHNDIPVGAGLGENAALAVATALTVRKLFPFRLGDSGATVPPKRNERGELPPLPAPERLHFARVCRNALGAARVSDEGWIGALTALAGRAWHALHLDCRFPTVDTAPFVGTALVLCDSGERPAEAPLARAETLDHCLAAARALGVKSLRSVEPRQVRAAGERLTTAERAAALHATGEIQRTAAAERALRDEDHRQLGQYLWLHDASRREHFGLATPEAELLLELARADRACLGARLSGGAGGATLHLVPYHEAEPFMARMAGQFAARTGRALTTWVAPIGAGAS